MKKWSFVALLLGATILVASGAGARSEMVISTCGTTVTADAVLASDLVCSGDGVVIGADNITIDLKLHALIGNGGAGELGIDNTAGHDQVTVKNGRITNFPTAVNIYGAAENRISQLVIRGGGILAQQCSSCMVDGNSVVYSGGHGVTLEGDSAVATDNVVRVGQDEGMDLGGTGLTVTGNTVVGSDTTNEGILLDNVDSSTIAKNRLSRGTLSFQDDSNDNTVESNTIARANNEGILVYISNGNRFALNQVLGSSSEGFEVSSSAKTLLRRNVATGNLADGILVDGRSHGTMLERNLADGNGADGFGSDSRTTVFKQNVAVGNGDRGIEAVAGDTDGGGNQARGNENPQQCSSVIACG
jgi:parallel beta-helix repeat protein